MKQSPIRAVPYFEDNSVAIYNCDFLKNELPDNSVQCIVTSPPYWGLRKYKAPDMDFTDWHGQFGLEPTIDQYVQHSVEILRECKRILRPDGVCFWNIGDSYSGGHRKSNPPQSIANGKESGHEMGYCPNRDIDEATGIKPKDLCLIPSRVALAAQADGWWVRSDIIWNKPNPMPESVQDRPTDAYEHIFMFTKSDRYYWDIEAVRESNAPATIERAKYAWCANDNHASEYQELNGLNRNEPYPLSESGRNLRNVWTFPTQPYKGAHFATFPQELPERCIKAATPEYGCCDKCGKPYERVIEKNNGSRTRKTGEGQDSSIGTAGRAGELETKTLGWQAACKCGGNPVSAVVLDPFTGSGTTLWVAKRLGRKGIGFEISPEYSALALERNRQGAIL